MRTSETESAGALIRTWRRRRRRSQLDLALDADVSQRHLSFVESGRAAPSRDMVLRLSDRLEVPLRDRNRILLAAGYAPAFGERPLGAPDMAPVLAAVRQVLEGHLPHPALAIDRRWTLLDANRAASILMAGAAPRLCEPPVNVLRLSLHPDGLAPRIRNLAEWRAHVLARLRRDLERCADPELAALAEELSAYPAPSPQAAPLGFEIATPLELRTDAGVLRLIGTTSVFGTATDVTLEELAIEAFFPADAATAARLAALLEAG